MSNIESLDFVRGENPHILAVIDGKACRRFLTDHDLDLCRYLANELITFVINRTGRAEGL